MSQTTRSVTWSPKDAARLPDWASGGCALIERLRQSGALAKVGERLRITRQGGYAGLDMFLFLLYFFCSGESGIRPFWRSACGFSEQLAAFAGRTKLPSPAAMSRAFKSVRVEDIRPLATWLLTEAAGAGEVLRHPSVLTRDARGQAWHVFHFDPTVTAIHQRPLPEGTDLPEPRRRAEEMSAPGFRGRKRGNRCFRRGGLSHAGSGLWLQAVLSRGNGERRPDLEGAADVVVATCKQIDHPLERALLVMDGEFAAVPTYSALRARKLPFITRFTRYEILDQPAVRQQLREATWLAVEDDRSGPRRSAIDLGIVTVQAGDQTRREDGTPFEPLSLRIVASRYVRSGEADHGRVLDGWQYELFVVDAAPEEWPAPEAVTQFFARTAVESRFAQEDREFQLDRKFSCHLPGQELACLIGLLCWNLHVVRGFELAPPPTDLGAPPARQATVDARATDAPMPPAAEPAEPLPAEPAEIDEARTRLLARIDWAPWRAKNPGWEWSAETGAVVCPNKQPLQLVGVSLPTLQPPAGARMFFRGRTGACEGCPFRPDCTRSQSEPFSKALGIGVDAAHAAELKETFLGKRVRRPSARPRRAKNVLAITMASPDPVAGPHAVTDAGFLPAEARTLFRDAARDLSVRVVVEIPRRSKGPVLLAPSRAHRQHRRKTWAENLARYSLPDGSCVQVEYSGGLAAQTLLNRSARATTT